MCGTFVVCRLIVRLKKCIHNAALRKCIYSRLRSGNNVANNVTEGTLRAASNNVIASMYALRCHLRLLRCGACI